VNLDSLVTGIGQLGHSPLGCCSGSTPHHNRRRKTHGIAAIKAIAAPSPEMGQSGSPLLPFLQLEIERVAAVDTDRPYIYIDIENRFQ